ELVGSNGPVLTARSRRQSILVGILILARHRVSVNSRTFVPVHLSRASMIDDAAVATAGSQDVVLLRAALAVPGVGGAPSYLPLHRVEQISVHEVAPH